MIVPIVGLKYYNFNPIQIGDTITFIKEGENLYDKNAVAVFNNSNQKIGYISKKSFYNIKVCYLMKQKEISGKIWAIFNSSILVELVLPKNPPPKNIFGKTGVLFN